MPFQSQIRTIDDLRGPAGRLEAILNTGIEDPPFTAIVAHPHPPSGGTMHTRAVYHAMKAFSSFGLPVLRFNFRGTGLSEGVHDEGRGEVDDVRAGLDWLTTNFAKPILFAGFSFGSNVGLRACCGDPRVKGLIGLGLPVQAAGRDYTYTFLPGCPQPKLFLLGDHDQFAPRAVMEQVFASAAEPKEMHWIAEADHFFEGIPDSPKPKLPLMAAAMRLWLEKTFHLTEPE
ncbi:alpha/beta hydrolase [Granulicella sp. WH15]|uniref:alpha/beta hydrolase n=1 Tax=Granulicella sp. WH15 TaxID=2602070 RepID=UPI0013669BCB|nr:alpha/beta family hydrolase [Granulicella sp. WH15]QHN03539.1 alpha/beta hydrolase [Granulicella sp. WH15]